MFIKNQRFMDEDTLLDVLFDFDLGRPTMVVTKLREQIEQELKENEAYQEYFASLTDEEEQLELATEERYIRLAEALMDQYESFEVDQLKLYGQRESNKTLLYEMDL